MKRQDLTGKKFSRYTVLSFSGIKDNRTMWLCRCDCGKEKVVSQNSLVRGNTTSCGCSRNKPKATAKHRLHGNPIYTVWIDIKRRCSNPKVKAYARYGAMGVSICDEWENSVTEFYNWCTANGWSKGMCVCRKGDKGNYAPDNCYIATRSQNSKDIYIFKKAV